jgi:hypothetical protein
LQLFAPFIHAHAFGLESLHAHAAHTHATEDMFHNHRFSSDLYLHIVALNQQDTVETPHAIGAVFKVANGVKRNADFDIVAIILASFLVLSLFVFINKYLTRPLNASLYPLLVYSPHAPRAPPN